MLVLAVNRTLKVNIKLNINLVARKKCPRATTVSWELNRLFLSFFSAFNNSWTIRISPTRKFLYSLCQRMVNFLPRFRTLSPTLNFCSASPLCSLPWAMFSLPAATFAQSATNSQRGRLFRICGKFLLHSHPYRIYWACCAPKVQKVKKTQSVQSWRNQK